MPSTQLYSAVALHSDGGRGFSQADVQYQQWLDKINPEAVARDLDAKFTGDEKVLFDAARRRAVGREKARTYFQRKFEERLAES